VAAWFSGSALVLILINKLLYAGPG